MYNLYAHCTSLSLHENEYATVIMANCRDTLSLLSQSNRYTKYTILENMQLSMIYTDSNGNIISLDDHREYIANQYNFTKTDIDDQSVIIQFQFDSFWPLISIMVPGEDGVTITDQFDQFYLEVQS